jgi:transposase-like protein
MERMREKKMSKMTFEEWNSRYNSEEASNYDREFRVKFISDYLLNPNLAAICRKHDVPYDTALSWKKKNWWYDISEDILQNHKEELLAKQRAILEKTYGELGDRLENGDEFFYPEAGHVRVKVKANHLATIADTTLKANQLLQGKATQISHVTIESLADKLRTITEEATIIDVTPSPLPDHTKG